MELFEKGLILIWLCKKETKETTIYTSQRQKNENEAQFSFLKVQC